jgi:hypothetical protein
MSSEDSEKIKQQLISYSTNVKMYAKWFDISEVKKNEDTFTTYKVVYRVSSPIVTLDSRILNFQSIYCFFLKCYHQVFTKRLERGHQRADSLEKIP